MTSIFFGLVRLNASWVSLSAVVLLDEPYVGHSSAEEERTIEYKKCRASSSSSSSSSSSLPRRIRFQFQNNKGTENIIRKSRVLLLVFHGVQEAAAGNNNHKRKTLKTLPYLYSTYVRTYVQLMNQLKNKTSPVLFHFILVRIGSVYLSPFAHLAILFLLFNNFPWCLWCLLQPTRKIKCFVGGAQIIVARQVSCLPAEEGGELPSYVQYRRFSLLTPFSTCVSLRVCVCVCRRGEEHRPGETVSRVTHKILKEGSKTEGRGEK